MGAPSPVTGPQVNPIPALLCVLCGQKICSSLRHPEAIPRPQATTTGIFPIFACHSFGPVWCTLLPRLSTATVTGMSCTSNS